MRRIATAMAAIALVAGSAYAQGNGKGNDRGGGKPAAAAQKGGGQGNARADKGGPSMAQSMRVSDNRGGGQAKRDERGGGQANNRGGGQANRPEQAGGQANREDRGGGNVNRAVVDRGRGNDDNRVVVDRGRGNDDRVVVDRRSGRFDDDDDAFVRIRDLDTRVGRGLIDGCPPGLAKKNPPCVPPGLARNDTRRLFGWDRPDFWGLSRLGDGRYFYDDGYLVRLGSDGRVASYVPLLGGALGIGNAWPSFYEPVRLPGYYESFYNLGPYGGYRYANDVIYRVDPETAAITSIAALLTGDDFAIGQPMPLGYDVYNVPYAYRDRYVDSPSALYRYSDGYIYQVDPETRLIAAVIELLT